MKDNRLQNAALLLLRVVAGLVIMYYGSQKLFGLFGGMGFQGTISAFQKGQGIPPVLAVFAIFGEFFGGLGLALGLLTRVAAFGVFCTMSVATFIHLRETHSLTMVGFNDPVNKFAYPMLIGTIALAILMMGGGAYSLDKKVFGGRRTR